MPENHRIIMDYEYQEKKEGNLLAEIYNLRNLYIIYKISKINFYLSRNTISGDFHAKQVLH
jgi:hypothetical protein